MTYEASTRFGGFIAGNQEIHGDKFDPSELNVNCISHYNAGDKRRVCVQFEDGTRHWGCIGVTTGWKPSFILLQNRRARSSGVLIKPGAMIVDSKDMKR